MTLSALGRTWTFTLNEVGAVGAVSRGEQGLRTVCEGQAVAGEDRAGCSGLG